jgi:hypothetical protein
VKSEMTEREQGLRGRGLALELSRRQDVSIQVESVFTPVLTHLSNEGKASEVSSQT